MNINNFRKYIFLNSQYCNYYIDEGKTVFAGIMRNFGYKCSGKLSNEKITLVNNAYRQYTILMNCLIGVEILLYVYFFIFPYFLQLMQMNYFSMVIMLSAIPLVMLYLTYITVNYFYEKFLARHVGVFQKVKFVPTIDNIDAEAYELYKRTPRKSLFVLVIMLGLFLFYVFTPIIAGKFVYVKKYSTVIKIANFYSKIIPISSDIYAKRAYAKFKMGKYEDAVKDYELANKYSFSNVFDSDILGVKTYYLACDEVIKEFDKTINHTKENLYKQYFLSEKARYLMKNKKYDKAVNIYDELIKIYENKENINFDLVEAYYNRGLAKAWLGDNLGAKSDIAIAKKMRPEHKLNLETKLIIIP